MKHNDSLSSPDLPSGDKTPAMGASPDTTGGVRPPVVDSFNIATQISLELLATSRDSGEPVRLYEILDAVEGKGLPREASFAVLRLLVNGLYAVGRMKAR